MLNLLKTELRSTAKKKRYYCYTVRTKTELINAINK